MIKINNLLGVLKKNSISFFTGVPDSVLKELSIYLRNFKNSSLYRKNIMRCNDIDEIKAILNSI